LEFTKIRNSFSIYVVDSELTYLDTIGEALKGSGYHVETFLKGEDAIEQIKAHPPHIVIAGTYLMGMTGLQLIRQVKALSPEIQSIIVANYAETDLALEALHAGAAHRIHKPINDIAEVISVVDQVAEKRYLEMTNEDLYMRLVAGKETHRRLRKRLVYERQSLQKSLELVRKLREINDPQELLNRFVREMGQVFENIEVSFVRFLPLQQQLIVTHAPANREKELKGVQIGLHEEVTLDELISTTFGYRCASHFAVLAKDQVIGYLIMERPMNDPVLRNTFEYIYETLQLMYDRLVHKKEAHEFKNRDDVTGLFDRRHFESQMAIEMSRARRLEKPLSLLLIRYDKEELPQEELKKLGIIITKTSRVTDIVCRYSQKEIVVLLPHTDRFGAAIKAEKLRRHIEKLNQHEEAATICIGVSEYPTLTMDAEGLIQSADSALMSIRKIKNKVCLSAAPNQHEPDFTVETSV